MEAPFRNDEDQAALGPDTPLWVGGGGAYTALVQPHLLYVEYLCSRAALAAMGNPGKMLHEALQRNPDPLATSGQIFGSVPQSAKEFAAIEAHERDHVRRLLSTSFGLLCHALRTQRLVAARNWVINAARQPGGLKLPFDLPARQPDLDSPAYRALTVNRLLQALETQLKTADLRTAESALAGWTADGCEYSTVDLPGDPEYATLQTTNAGKALTAKWLTAYHLFELFGACEEGNRLLATGSGVEQVARRLEMTDRWYTLPLLVWFTQFPTSAGRTKQAIRPPRLGELPLSFFRTFPLELFAAADLALWLPFAPEGLTSAQRELDWTDVSPAFRFARTLLAYKRLGVTPGGWPDDGINAFVPELQRRVCEMYGWPTPVDLAARWHDHLASRSNTWFPDAALGGFRYTTTLQLLALRRDRPGDVVINNVDFQAARVGRSAGWITLESDNRLVPMTLAAAADREATEFWFRLHLLTPAILGPANGEMLGNLKRYPHEIRRACVDAFDTWGRVVDGWPYYEFRREATTMLDI